MNKAGSSDTISHKTWAAPLICGAHNQPSRGNPLLELKINNKQRPGARNLWGVCVAVSSGREGSVDGRVRFFFHAADPARGHGDPRSARGWIARFPKSCSASSQRRWCHHRTGVECRAGGYSYSERFPGSPISHSRNFFRGASGRLEAGACTAVFTFVEKKEGFFPNSGSTAVSFLLVLLAFD